MRNLSKRMENATVELCILEGAVEFIGMNSDESIDYNNKGLCDILWVLRKFTEKVANEMADIDLELRKLAQKGYICG